MVELEVLRQIEQALGGKLPIQKFFDLIIGTRLDPHDNQVLVLS